MKESVVLLEFLIMGLMLTMVVLPAEAWEYWNTTIWNTQTDNLVDFSEPHADRIQIVLLGNKQAELQSLEAPAGIVFNVFSASAYHTDSDY